METGILGLSTRTDGRAGVAIGRVKSTTKWLYDF